MQLPGVYLTQQNPPIPAAACPDVQAAAAPIDLLCLPAELLQLIAKKLAPVDYVHFRHANQHLYQVLDDPVVRKEVVRKTVLLASAHCRAVTVACPDQAVRGTMEALEFMSGAWGLLNRQKVEPRAGSRLCEKTFEKIESLAHVSSDSRRNVIENNQLFITRLQQFASVLTPRLDAVVNQTISHLCLALARQAMRCVATTLRAPLLNHLMTVLPLTPENRCTDTNLQALKLMAAGLNGPDEVIALSRLKALAPRARPIEESALLSLTTPTFHS